MTKKTYLCIFLMIYPPIMCTRMHTDNLKKLVMIKSLNKIKLNMSIKKKVKTSLHVLMMLVLPSTNVMMMMMMMDPFKEDLRLLTQECIKAFNGIIPLITYWDTFNEG